VTLFSVMMITSSMCFRVSGVKPGSVPDGD
jgi:hypothetical protein